MTQRFEPFFQNITQRIELFYKTQRIELFDEYDSKNWSLFESVTQRIELFFEKMTQRI